MAVIVTQAIVVRKDGPNATPIAALLQAAQVHGSTHFIRTRETSASRRFRVRPPEDFVPGTFRTRTIDDHTSVIEAELRDLS